MRTNDVQYILYLKPPSAGVFSHEEIFKKIGVFLS